MSAVTQWFDMDKKPRRRGVYELRRADGNPWKFSYWNGMHFCVTAGSVLDALLWDGIGSFNASMDVQMGCASGWRGLSEKPE